MARRFRSRPGRWRPPRVVEVREGSPCGGLVKPGDLLLKIGAKTPLDILDYLEASEARRVSLRLQRDGRAFACRVRKEAGIPLGLVFDRAVFDGVRTCRNRCVFCYVDQLPPGLRPTLYVRDDDYRLSFYYGNFVTLNNLSRDDLRRILRLRLSPLYVSLHSTHPGLRSQLMGGDARRGLEALELLLGAGIAVHLQVVVCPGINDGEALRRTLADVLHRQEAASLGVVPLGLTARAAALPLALRPHDRRSSRAVLAAVEEFQERALERAGRRLFFAADEFYLMAGVDFPPEDAYEGYPQLDNGIGMARKFVAQACAAARLGGREVGRGRGVSTGAALGGKARDTIGRRGVLTGEAGERVIRRIIADAALGGVEVKAVRNRLLGSSVTVTSLLSGGDIMSALREDPPFSRELLLPEAMLREGRFLDGLTPGEVERETGFVLVPLEVDGARLVRALDGRGD